MGRGGSTVIEKVEDILYGDTRPRILGKHALEIANGVTGFFDADRVMYKFEVDADIQYLQRWSIKDPKTGKQRQERKTWVGPVSVHVDGRGRPHRTDGPTMITPQVSSWYKDGVLHREDAPAVTKDDGFEAWHLHGQYHREDGPALSWPSGERSWYLHGTEYPNEAALRSALVGGIEPPEEDDPDAVRTLEDIAAEEVCPYDGGQLEVAEENDEHMPFRCTTCGKLIT